MASPDASKSSKKQASPPPAAEEKNTGSKGYEQYANIDFDSWEQEQVGFAPYWNPEPGKYFVGTVQARDERDPEFVRYLVKTYQPMIVSRGAKDDQEHVNIDPGDLFTISDYFSLTEPFNFILEHFTANGIEVPLMLRALKQKKTKKSGQTCWTWEMKVPPEWKVKLASKREEIRLRENAKRDTRMALEESTDEDDSEEASN